MQKFPLRMKDNDLLVTELYKDPGNDPITAISVYLTPKTSKLLLLKTLSISNQIHVSKMFLAWNIIDFSFVNFVQVCVVIGLK